MKSMPRILPLAGVAVVGNEFGQKILGGNGSNTLSGAGGNDTSDRPPR